MQQDEDPSTALLVRAMWSYAGSVLEPWRALRQSGLVPVPAPKGDELLPLPRPGKGPGLAMGKGPVMADEESPHAALVESFDKMAEAYEAYVRPFSTPLFDEALTLLAPIVPRDARALDLGCGPGRELRRMAALVPDGVAVGVDLAAGMLRAAYRSARAAGLDNTAFYQADAGELPSAFDGAFDVVYNCLAHHHFPDPPAAAASAFRALRPGGIYAVIDPGPDWYNQVSAPLARLTDPGWIGFHNPDQFMELLGRAGFARTCWYDLLPGFGLFMGQSQGLA